MRRKLFICTLFLILGTAAGYFYFLFSIIAVSVSALLLKFVKMDIRQTIYKVIVCFFIAGFMMMSCCQLREMVLYKSFDGQDKEYTGTVESVKVRKGKDSTMQSEFIIGIQNFNNSIFGTKIFVKKYKGDFEDYSLYGRKVIMKGKLQIPESNGNPRCFDYGMYLKSRNIYFTSSTAHVELSDVKPNGYNNFKRYIFLRRELFIRNLKCDDETKGLIKGILFGDTGQMSENLQDEFRDNGTAHVLAVSGLHVGILYSIYRRFRKRKKSDFFTVSFILLLLCYGVVTLWSVSVSRAIALIIFKILADKLNLRFDLLSSVSGICIYMILKNPWIIFGADFQMSFLAVTAIAFCTPYLSKWIPEEAAAAISIQAGIIPYVAYTFNKVPVIAIICNIPIVMVLSVLLPVSMTAFGISFIVKSSNLISDAVCVIGSLLIKLNEVINFNGLFTVDVVSPNLFTIVVFYLLMFFMSSELLVVLIHRKMYKDITKIICIILTIGFIIFASEKSDFDRAFAVMVDVGQGDCLHVKSKDNRNIIFDGGGRTEYNVGEKILKPYFLHNGKSRLEGAFVTHLHTDHYKGIEELNRCFKIGKVIYKGRRGDKYSIGKGVFVEILWPEKQDFTIDDENENSLIFKVTVDGTSILVTGDIGKDGEARLIERYRGTGTLKCDILKIPHHGSKYSSSDEFLKETDPKIAIIGVGKNNYGHPSDEVIEKLHQKGIITYRTDHHGAVGVIKERGRIRLCHQRRKRSEVFGTLQWTIKKVY